jgi:L-asparaginase/Glu-tRNA(Gln) amidotransferase subunit D
MKDFAAYYDACVEMRLVPRISSDSMTKEQCDALLNAVEKNFAVPAEDAAV